MFAETFTILKWIKEVCCCTQEMIWFKSKSLEPDRKQLPTSTSNLPREGSRSCPPRPPGADEGRGWSLGFHWVLWRRPGCCWPPCVRRDARLSGTWMGGGGSSVRAWGSWPRGLGSGWGPGPGAGQGFSSAVRLYDLVQVGQTKPYWVSWGCINEIRHVFTCLKFGQRFQTLTSHRARWWSVIKHAPTPPPPRLFFFSRRTQDVSKWYLLGYFTGRVWLRSGRSGAGSHSSRCPQLECPYFAVKTALIIKWDFNLKKHDAHTVWISTRTFGIKCLVSALKL